MWTFFTCEVKNINDHFSWVKFKCKM